MYPKSTLGRVQVIGGSFLLATLLAACAGQTGSADGGAGAFNAPWLSFYGTAAQLGDSGQVAATFRLINIDADSEINFTREQIATLKAGGRNRVISYLNLGACEQFRSYYKTAPSGLVPCETNLAAQRGPYRGFPDEVWMDPSNADYQKLILDHVAPRLAATGVDGFFFDNLEIVEHGTQTSDGPCNAACAQGGLDLVRTLRERFPALFFVMQNATSDVTRLGMTGGASFPLLLDGVSHEEVYAPTYDPRAEAQLSAWRGLYLMPHGHPFSITTEDYVGDCGQTDAARAAYEKSRAYGFSPYATDASAGQRVVCFWPF